MWFAYPSNSANWYKVSVDQVKEIIALNKQGKVIDNIEDYVFEEEDTSFHNVVAEDSLSRFDEPKRKRRSPRNKKKQEGKPEVIQSEKRMPVTKREPKKPQHETKNGTANQPKSKLPKSNQPKANTSLQTVKNNTPKTLEDKVANSQNQTRKKNFRKPNKNNGNKPNRKPDDSKQ